MIQNLNIKDFLDNYWQKKPLLIRSAFPDYISPITPEELAGLACEDFIESRIISESKTEPKWKVENGPFAESKFPELPDTHWTLLIQGLNKIFPEFDDLLHQFNFIPSWRVDDVMASYASPNGSVGPHIDQYDVFLLQASGKRKWIINEEPVNEENFEADLPLKIIKNFEATSEWILEAGDMLYLPPNVSHYGIGMEDCMTFSIGFRAPSHAELLSSYIDDHISHLKDDQRYKDPQLSSMHNSGEISSSAIKKIQESLVSHFNDISKIEDWFARYITEYHNDDDDQTENNLSAEEFIQQFKIKGSLRRPASVRANYLINQNNELTLYINGYKHAFKSGVNDSALLYCNQHIHHYEDLKSCLDNKNVVDFFSELYNSGYIEFSDE